MANEKLLTGIDAAVHGVWGRYRRRATLLGDLRTRAVTIHSRSLALQALADEPFAAAVTTMAEALNRDPVTARGQLAEALAVLAEAAARTLGKRPYVVQLMGALALHHGYVAEMATGEGKTLTVGLAAILAGWSGRPCHVLTANDYLAQRDASELEPLFALCKLQVASCIQEMAPEERQALYVADLVYVTPKTLLADYLRDELTRRAARGAGGGLMLPRGIYTAIVDEADSMLIDESITPLIISAPKDVPGLHQGVMWAYQRAQRLVLDHDYRIAPTTRRIELAIGADDPRLAPDASLPTLWRSAERRIDLISQALQVRENFIQGVHYVVDADKIVLIDEFTGRLTPERSLSGGLHQAIEAREGVEMTDPNMPLVQMTFQRFFQRFKRLACTTGTAHEAAPEFWHIYHKAVLRIPTNRPRRVERRPPVMFVDRHLKFSAIVTTAITLAEQGHPVLIGVRSLVDSEQLGEQMSAAGSTCHILNAVHHQRESEIIALAGDPGTITIATNMAGRGVDIHLAPEVLAAGGLHVLICEPNDSSRVDRQLAGRCGRQGSPGVVHHFYALDDKVLMQHLHGVERALLHALIRGPQSLQTVLLPPIVARAQKRFDKRAYLNRKSLLEAEEWLDKSLPFNQVS